MSSSDASCSIFETNSIHPSIDLQVGDKVTHVKYTLNGEVTLLYLIGPGPPVSSILSYCIFSELLLSSNPRPFRVFEDDICTLSYSAILNTPVLMTSQYSHVFSNEWLTFLQLLLQASNSQTFQCTVAQNAISTYNDRNWFAIHTNCINMTDNCMVGIPSSNPGLQTNVSSGFVMYKLYNYSYFVRNCFTTVLQYSLHRHQRSAH